MHYRVVDFHQGPQTLVMGCMAMGDQDMGDSKIIPFDPFYQVDVDMPRIDEYGRTAFLGTDEIGV